MAELSRFAFPTDVRFGAGAIAELPAVLRALGVARPLVVTDRGLARLPLLANVLAHLDGAGVPHACFTEVDGNPVESNVTGALAAYRDGGCDVVVGLGGGSSIDVAKAVALMATHDGKIFDYDDTKGGSDRIRPDVAPVIAVPTTAGTGSEVGRSTVIGDVESHRKVVVFSPYLMPRVAIVDPELMLGLPPAVTAATGMDALTHNVEAFLAKGYHPMCDGIALEGIHLVSQHLRRAVEDGSDLEARSGMAMASLMGAVAFQKGLGATHSLAHPLSSVSGLHHGLANGVLVARVMEFNSEVSRERLARIGLVVGAQGAQADLVHGAIRFVDGLAKVIGIPRTLTEAGVRSSDLDELTRLAFEDGCHQLNPRPVSEDDLRGLYRAAM